ncbi:MAG: SUMF1/EgtB/PvdO family nonheme iron enzyme [Xenococcaceae cyanobacterium MO_167.B52]|nr:SUMF1/EgtB/PvdO family nonheme iron enzyme [Xenococcaceae cyanobacterium MO_167.B52]
MDGSAWLSEDSRTKILRGGSWYINPDSCRSAYRNERWRDKRDIYIGFRVACVAHKIT